jgi:hypothetical protein
MLMGMTTKKDHFYSSSYSLVLLRAQAQGNFYRRIGLVEWSRLTVRVRILQHAIEQVITVI